MSARDELAAVLRESRSPWVTNTEHRAMEEAQADAILAAGYRKMDLGEAAARFVDEELRSRGWVKPRTITTAEELDALPNGTVVLSIGYHSDVDGTAISFQRWYDGDWHRGARSGSTHPDNFLPVTVLHEPTL
jgi:hypothetical protein